MPRNNHYIWLQVSFHPFRDDYFIPSLFKFLVPLSSFPLVMPLYLTLLSKYSKPDKFNTSIKPLASIFVLSVSSCLPQRQVFLLSKQGQRCHDALDPVSSRFRSLSCSSFFPSFASFRFSLARKCHLYIIFPRPHILLCVSFRALPLSFPFPSHLSSNLSKLSFCSHQIFWHCFL